MRFLARWLPLVFLTLGALLLKDRRPVPATEAAADHPRSLKAFWIAVVLAMLTTTAYGAYTMLQQHMRTRDVAYALTNGDMSRAPALLRKYGCGGCHTISGVPGADGQVGGALDGLRHRVFIAGVVRNTPDTLMAWMVSPQDFSPNSAMPRTGITPEEARDVAAFLYTR